MIFKDKNVMEPYHIYLINPFCVQWAKFYKEVWGLVVHFYLLSILYAIKTYILCANGQYTITLTGITTSVKRKFFFSGSYFRSKKEIFHSNYSGLNMYIYIQIAWYAYLVYHRYFWNKIIRYKICMDGIHI